jgi:hypothetical protein
MAEEKLPYWTHAPEDVRQESHALLDRLAREQDETRANVDWMKVSRDLAEWWKERGHRYP